MPWLALALGAGAGLVKSEAVDRPKEDRDRQLAAATQRFAPWTGLKAGPITEADPLGSALTYGAQGAQLQQNIQNSQAQQGLVGAQTNWLNHGGSPLATAATSNPNSSSYSGNSGGWGLLSGYNYNQTPGNTIFGKF